MTLYIVSTPIGNLEDITLRALNVLKTVDLIAAEDTRHSKKLLSHYDIKVPLTSYHSYSSHKKVEDLIARMLEGNSVALISDAGTPGISDPAWSLIQAALEAEITVVPIPGAAAFLTALVGSGLPMNQFEYMGFIPAKKGRHTLFESILKSPRTTIFYESPHRIKKTVEQLYEALGPKRKVVLARELTKIHETFFRGNLEALKDHVQKNPLKGEMVLLVGPHNL